jgi:hypothetical protein
LCRHGGESQVQDEESEQSGFHKRGVKHTVSELLSVYLKDLRDWRV